MPPQKDPLKKIEHIVVLMLENRSFDNVLGWLYDPANEPPYDKVPVNFEGLSGRRCTNPTPDGTLVAAGKTENPRSPQPNPGEPFEDVYSQIYDVPLRPLKDVPPNPTTAANMQGFIRNYAEQKDRPADPTSIMNSLTPKTVPVLSALAHNYALCDHWFASVPTQTFCNRSFVHAGTSSGYVNNGGAGFCFVNDTPTIFDILEEVGKSWKIYCGSWLLETFALITQKRLWKHALSDHFQHFKDFLAATKKGSLPSYAFIEPIYFDSIVWGPRNDAHPECNPYEFYGPSSVHHAEALVWKIYDAVRNGPDWETTLLLIVFDEHGGCHDHVAPPTSRDCGVAIAPDDHIIPAGQPGGAGFKFDRLGPRVPAIIVSAYTAPQTRLNAVLEHTSVLSTVVNCFDLPKGRLGRRQQAASDLGAALNLLTPRADQPNIPKPERSLLEDLRAEAHAVFHRKLSGATTAPLTDLQKTSLHGAAMLIGEEQLHDRIGAVTSELGATLLLLEQEAKLAKKKYTGE
ncbi:MAG TPA: alkaline phosphatase family protein [Candidatus Acidoferrum sp.]|nr:alkaline phosphatase family protein [Candidatus Acidoferrum sp.]